jgi:3-methyl-2-oxobutanoate hydroxymethyltransferase
MTKITAPSLAHFKQDRRPIVAVTSYDFMTTQLLNEVGVDVVLVGDSLGMVKLGYTSTLPVTVEDMLYHTRIVARGNSRALLVTDMPFISYQASPVDAVRNAGAMIKAGAEAVKLEGGEEMLPAILALKKAKIPVMGHLGLTPQSVHEFGGYKVQGKNPAARRKLLRDARSLETAGVFALVLEGIPADLARQITKSISIPTIGIGAGPACDGQVLVIDDLLGLTPPPHPRFVKAYADLRGMIRKAVGSYASEVRGRRFPEARHSY